MATPLQIVQGTARLAFDSVGGITNTVERMHETISRNPLLPPDRTNRAHGAIAAGVYAAIRGINSALGAGVDRSIGVIPDVALESGHSSASIKMIAALNGVVGDHLEATSNPLATRMSLMTPQHEVPLDHESLKDSVPIASPHLLVLVHGLGMSELSWGRKGAPCIGERLHADVDIAPLYLRYNTGRHISTNGQELAQQLEQLCAAWPVPVESLSLIGHSMGGLVIRSACWYAGQESGSWLSKLQRVVCLGTPHHGSAVAKAGHGLTATMKKIPYIKPLAFGERLSAGIKDLRHGNLLDEDWIGDHPDKPGPDKRQVLPLLEHVEYYFLAATLGRHADDPLGHVLGDLLVRMESATGSHEDDLRHLSIKPENCRVFHQKNHFDLLDDAQVQQQILDWFSV